MKVFFNRIIFWIATSRLCAPRNDVGSYTDILSSRHCEERIGATWQSRKNITYLFLFLIFFSINANALSPEARLTDETQENRAMNLFLEVRCLVCQGQVIESSDTEFSFQMRKLIRTKISQGKSDEEIKADLVNEFGENILIKPNLKSQFLLWFLPLIFAIFLGIFLLFRK